MPNKKKKGFNRPKKSTDQVIARPLLSNNRSSIRKQWSNEQMQAALNSVVCDGISANKAALLHGVPRSTLKDRLSGRVVHGRNPGPEPYLNVEEEQELAGHLINASNIGYGKTRQEVLNIVERYVERKEHTSLRSSTVTHGWWQKFLKRNPSLSLRAGDSTASIRMDAINAENLKNYYDQLRSLFDEYDFENHPEAIYNMDETGVPLEPRPPKIVAQKGKEKIRYQTSGQKQQITVIGCGSATGQCLPPFVIFAAKQLNHLWTANEVNGSRFAVSDNGWVDHELFYSFLQKHFLTNAVSHRPLMLLLDGYSTHCDLTSLKFARDKGIIIFCLPPHTTHECQPLDCSLFKPLKQHWKLECHKFYSKNPGKVISKLNFNGIFRNAWLKAITPENVVAGFRKTGVYPFNRDAVSCSDNAVSTSEENDKDVMTQGMDEQGEDEWDSNKDEPDPLNDKAISLENELPYAESDDLANPEPNVPDYTGLSLTATLGHRDKSVPNSDFSADAEEALLCSRRLQGYDVTDGMYETWLNARHPALPNFQPTFSAAEEMLYTQRYEEGYDLPDPKYEAWLNIHHPSAEITSDVIAPSPITDVTTLSSIAGLHGFSNVTPVYIDIPTGSSTDVCSISIAHSSDENVVTPVRSISQSYPTQLKFSVSPKAHEPLLSESFKSGSPNSVRSSLPSEEKRSPLAELVNIPKIDNQTKKTSKARVLTSNECIKAFEEKEQKKRLAEEEKKRKKTERELKRKQKEEELNHKKELRAQKVSLKEAKQREKEAMKEAKQREKEAKQQEKQKESKRKCINSGSSRAKRRKATDNVDDEIDDDRCCTSFGVFSDDEGTAREWVMCSCNRWIHEDCIDPADINDETSKVCPLC